MCVNLNARYFLNRSANLITLWVLKCQTTVFRKSILSLGSIFAITLYKNTQRSFTYFFFNFATNNECSVTECKQQIINSKLKKLMLCYTFKSQP